MKNMHIETSPLTGTIYMGPVNKAGTEFMGDKKDVTNLVLRAVLEKAELCGGCIPWQGGVLYVTTAAKARK